jgi:tetratricopeptide (TPR) repeat protein
MRIILYLSIFLINGVVLSQNIEELINQGDFYAEKEFNNKKALELYLQAEKIAPNNHDILWRISRAFVDIAEHMPDATSEQKKEQEKIYNLALEYAERSVKIAPDKTITLLRRAIANGRIALYKGVFSVSGVVNSVKEDLEKAISLNNSGPIALATSYYVLARTHSKTSEKSKLFRMPLGLGWADLDKAIEYFEKAIKLRPDFRMYRLDYAKALIKKEDNKKAIEQLEAIKNIPKYDEDDDEFLKEAEKLIKELKK